MTELISPRVRSLCRGAAGDPDGFWAAAAAALPWFRPWDAVFDWEPDRPDERGRYFRWFTGGRTNLAWNCVDRHVERGWGGHAALVCLNERGDRQVLTPGSAPSTWSSSPGSARARSASACGWPARRPCSAPT